MDKIIELRQQRAAVIEEARTILDKAESENRDLTPEENQKYEALLTQGEGIANRLRRAENQGDVERVLAESAGRQTDLQMGGGSSGAARFGELRFITSKEKLCEVVPVRDRKFERCDLGKLISIAAGKNPAGDCSLERRALSEGSDTAGGFLVPETISQDIWDLARAKAAVFKAGATTVVMKAETVRIPKLVSDPSGHWKPEGVSADEASMEFAAFEMHAFTLFFWLPISNELLEDASHVDVSIRNAMSKACAIQVETACLFGTGALQPMGIYADGDVTKTATISGGYWGDISDAIMRVQNANLEPSGVMMSPRTMGLLRGLQDGEGNYIPTPAWAPQLFVTKQVKDTLGAGSDESCIFVGDWKNLIVGIRTPFRLEILKEVEARKNQTVVMGMMRCDAGVIDSTAFQILTGLTTVWG